MPSALAIIKEPEAASAALTPTRRRILDALRRPGSATSVASGIGLTRQKVNYHLRELERLELVEHVEDRKRGNCIERVMQAKAEHFLIDPGLLGTREAVERASDRHSSDHLALASARTVSDLATLRDAADRVGKKVPTFSLETAIRFADASDQAAFLEELSDSVTELISRYHDATADGGRWFRLLVGSHPATRNTIDQESP